MQKSIWTWISVHQNTNKQMESSQMSENEVSAPRNENNKPVTQTQNSNPKWIPMRMRNARNSIPNVFHAKGWKKLPSCYQGGEKLQLQCSAQRGRRRRRKRRAGAEAAQKQLPPGTFTCHAMVAHFAVTNNNKNAISRRSINSQLGGRETVVIPTRAVDCVKFQTKRRVRLPKRGYSSYGSQHGSSAAGTAAQAPQLAGKRKHSLELESRNRYRKYCEWNFWKCAELGGCFCPQPNLVQLQ